MDRPGFLARGEADAETNNRQVSLHVFGLQGIKKEQPPFGIPLTPQASSGRNRRRSLTASTGLRIPLTDRLIQSCLVGLVDEIDPFIPRREQTTDDIRSCSGASGFFNSDVPILTVSPPSCVSSSASPESTATVQFASSPILAWRSMKSRRRSALALGASASVHHIKEAENLSMRDVLPDT